MISKWYTHQCFNPGLWTLPAELESLGIAHCQQARDSAAQPWSRGPSQPILG